MKLQQEVQGQSRETLWPWDDWLRNQEHKQSLEGMLREEMERASRSIPGSEPGVMGRIWHFLVSPVGHPCLKGSLCSSQQSLKADLKG